MLLLLLLQVLLYEQLGTNTITAATVDRVHKGSAQMWHGTYMSPLHHPVALETILCLVIYFGISSFVVVCSTTYLRVLFPVCLFVCLFVSASVGRNIAVGA